MSHLLKTKAQPHFDRTVTDRSKSLFCLISTSNHVIPCFRLGSCQLRDAICLLSVEHPANRLLRIAQSNTNVKRIFCSTSRLFGLRDEVAPASGRNGQIWGCGLTSPQANGLVFGKLAPLFGLFRHSLKSQTHVVQPPAVLAFLKTFHRRGRRCHMCMECCKF
jgi:hypothetical protein